LIQLDDLLYRQPIPVCLKRKDLKGELERAIFSTYMHQNRGTCTCVPHCTRFSFESLTKTSVSHSSVKFGTLSQSPAQVLANLETALPAIIAAVRGGWDNVQSLNIKSTKSLSLPIWSCKLGTGEGARWHGLTLEDEKSDDDDDIEAAIPEVPHKAKLAKSNKHPPDRGKKPVAA
jgi:ribosome biogenesis protein UTP30